MKRWAMGLAVLTLVGTGIGFAGEANAEAVAAVKAEMVAAIDANAEANEKVKAFVKSTLLPQSTNEIFVAEVKKQNDKKMSLDEIKKIDQEWKDAEDELPIQMELLNNATATEMKKIVQETPAIVEAFVMDNQGANVGQNALTGDYWQGDEAKWKNSYHEGKGGVDVGKVEFDKSANAQLQQISLPIIDTDGTVVGAVTYGINIDTL